MFAVCLVKNFLKQITGVFMELHYLNMRVNFPKFTICLVLIFVLAYRMLKV